MHSEGKVDAWGRGVDGRRLDCDLVRLRDHPVHIVSVAMIDPPCLDILSSAKVQEKGLEGEEMRVRHVGRQRAAGCCKFQDIVVIASTDSKVWQESAKNNAGRRATGKLTLLLGMCRCTRLIP